MAVSSLAGSASAISARSASSGACSTLAATLAGGFEDIWVDAGAGAAWGVGALRSTVGAADATTVGRCSGAVIGACKFALGCGAAAGCGAGGTIGTSIGIGASDAVCTGTVR